MAVDTRRVISIAVVTGKMGCVLIVGRKVECWKMYRRCKLGPFHAGEQTWSWINAMNPDALITENVGWKSRKAKRTIRNIQTVEETGRNSGLIVKTILKHRRFKSKFEEASALCKIYPEMQELLPDKKRKFFDCEPHRMIYFEALSMLHVAYSGVIEVVDR
jgi:hypothetical protein